MITDIRPTEDDDVVLAVGERYDVGKILEAMCGILDDYAAFAGKKGLEEPYTLATPKPPRPGDDPIVKLLKSSSLPFKLPYGGHTMRIVGKLVDEERESYDAGGLRRDVEAPPFRFDLHPLGAEPLYANFGMCREPGIEARWLTLAGESATAFDPAPIMRIHRHLPPRAEGTAGNLRPKAEYCLTWNQRKLLTEFLETQRSRGIVYETGANGLVSEPLKILFPHDAFGAGAGDIRVALLRAGGD